MSNLSWISNLFQLKNIPSLFSSNFDLKYFFFKHFDLLLYRIVKFYLILYGTFDSAFDARQSLRENKQEIFDFIIVGGGVSGGVLSDRLSENYKVLLLEYGGNPPLLSLIPALTFPLYGVSQVDFKYQTTPQKHASLGLINNQTPWPSGKNLGGSSSLNAMIYIRGNVQGFDQIGKDTGDSIWSMKNALNYFRKIEDYYGYFNNQKNSHGKGGRQSIETGNLSPFIPYLLNASEELGIPIRDPNDGPLKEGIAPIDYYMKNGARFGTYEARLVPKLKHKNLKIRRYSNVYKVLFDENNEAKGVEYLRHGKVEMAFATKEIILSAGAAQTAKILMLSGIGSPEELERIGVPLRLNLPVGEGLTDKYGAYVGPFLVNKGYSYISQRDLTLRSLIKWLLKGKGTFSSTRAEASFSYCSSIQKLEEGKRLNESCYNPDIHSYIIAQSVEFAENFAQFFNMKPSFVNYFREIERKDSFFHEVNLARPFSSGRLRLVDATPNTEFLLDPGYLKHPRDVKALVDGIKFAVNLVENTESFKKIGAKLYHVHLPGCEAFKLKSDEYYECIARLVTATAFKYCNTTPINKVVDSRLRVIGTKNLRIVGAPVLNEKIVSVNQVSCQVIGEMASDFIIDHWENETK